MGECFTTLIAAGHCHILPQQLKFFRLHYFHNIVSLELKFIIARWRYIPRQHFKTYTYKFFVWYFAIEP